MKKKQVVLVLSVLLAVVVFSGFYFAFLRGESIVKTYDIDTDKVKEVTLTAGISNPFDLKTITLNKEDSDTFIRNLKKLRATPSEEISLGMGQKLITITYQFEDNYSLKLGIGHQEKGNSLLIIEDTREVFSDAVQKPYIPISGKFFDYQQIEQLFESLYQQ